jgi:hypothetical protein
VMLGPHFFVIWLPFTDQGLCLVTGSHDRKILITMLMNSDYDSFNSQC